MKNYDLLIASDHAGYLLKCKIVDFLQQRRLKVLDLGTNSNESVDYPDFAKLLVEEIISETAPLGILICNTGIGMSIAANRNSDIRAALCINELMAKQARLHNNANILILGSSLTSDKESYKILDKFLTTKFEGGRHNRRLSKIS